MFVLLRMRGPRGGLELVDFSKVEGWQPIIARPIPKEVAQGFFFEEDAELPIVAGILGGQALEFAQLLDALTQLPFANEDFIIERFYAFVRACGEGADIVPFNWLNVA